MIKVAIKKISIIASSILLLAGFFLLSVNYITDEESENQVIKEKKSKQQYTLPYTPKNITFAGERVPLEQFDVRESLDNEMLANAFWQSQMFRFLKRANRYFPVIEPILKKNNIPNDFKYLAVAESGLADVVSPAKAAGKWQFLRTTAREYGLEVNKYVDERYHLEKATQAACDYLNEAYKKLGNWTLVAASYNMGMNGLERRLQKQKVSSYYDLFLNRETARYIFRIIAIKLVMEHPEQYGFRYKSRDLYPLVPTKIIEVDSTVADLRIFALDNACNYKILKALNPWLRNTSLPIAQNKSYQLYLPKDGFRKFANSKQEAE